jgi:hypothetical protein
VFAQIPASAIVFDLDKLDVGADGPLLVPESSKIRPMASPDSPLNPVGVVFMRSFFDGGLSEGDAELATGWLTFAVEIPKSDNGLAVF